MAKDILLAGHFVTSEDGTGVTGLAVTMDVWRVALADLSKSQIVTDGSMTEIGDGLYAYRIASANLQSYYYFGVCKTSDATVAQKQLGAVNLDFADSPGLVTLLWNALTSGLTTVGSIGKRLADYVTGDAYARLGAPVGASIAADLAEIEAETDGIAALPTAAQIDTQLSGAHGAGAWGGAGGTGASEFTVTVDDGSNPLDGVEVWVTTDLGGSNIVASGTTETDGTVTFMLDPGTYYLWKQLARFNATNPEAITVT